MWGDFCIDCCWLMDYIQQNIAPGILTGLLAFLATFAAENDV